MSSLMVLNRAWNEQVYLFEQLCFAQDGDAILLIEDAVLGLQSPIALASFLAKCQANNIKLFALADDCDLRGIDNKYADIELIDYDAYVGLVVTHQKQVAW